MAPVASTTSSNRGTLPPTNPVLPPCVEEEYLHAEQHQELAELVESVQSVCKLSHVHAHLVKALEPADRTAH